MAGDGDHRAHVHADTHDMRSDASDAECTPPAPPLCPHDYAHIARGAKRQIILTRVTLLKRPRTHDGALPPAKRLCTRPGWEPPHTLPARKRRRASGTDGEPAWKRRRLWLSMWLVHAGASAIRAVAAIARLAAGDRQLCFRFISRLYTRYIQGARSPHGLRFH